MSTARQDVQQSLQNVRNAQSYINSALVSVEQSTNRQLIQSFDLAIANCFNEIQNCLNNYHDAP